MITSYCNYLFVKFSFNVIYDLYCLIRKSSKFLLHLLFFLIYYYKIKYRIIYQKIFKLISSKIININTSYYVFCKIISVKLKISVNKLKVYISYKLINNK